MQIERNRAKRKQKIPFDRFICCSTSNCVHADVNALLGIQFSVCANRHF